MKTKKRFAIFFITLICLLAAAFSLVACESVSYTTDPNAYYQDKKVKVTDVSLNVEYSPYLNWWDTTVSGVAENVSGKDYSYAQILFTMYDADGFILGTAIDNISGLRAGEKWKFEAFFYTTKGEPTQFKFDSFTAF